MRAGWGFIFWIQYHEFIIYIVIQEFMIATDMTSSGDPEEKLRWAFKMYDKDASGKYFGYVTFFAFS